MKKDWILDALYPKRCPICDAIMGQMNEKRGFCRNCYEKLPFITGNRCYLCGRPVSDSQKELCPDCIKNRRIHSYDRGFSLFVYKDLLRLSMYRLKYGGRSEYGAVYGKLLAQYFGKACKRAGVDSVIAVPLHKKRLAQRGYNQAELLAKAFARETGIPFYPGFLVRVKNTKPLKSMSPGERQNNLKKAFKISRNDVKLNITIVIDDIYTTGSTLDQVSAILKDAGVKKIYFLTVTIGENR